MKTVELADATASLSEYARQVRDGTVVVTRNGKPMAALMAVGSKTDLENLTVTTDAGFMEMIERSRRRYPPGTGLTTEEVKAELAQRTKPGTSSRGGGERRPAKPKRRNAG